LIEKFEHRRIRATCGLFPHKKTDRPFPDDPIKRSNKDRFQKAAANTSRPNRQPTPLAQSGGRRRSPKQTPITQAPKTQISAPKPK
jgi:hypothetical protein